jgi:ribokinase
MKNIVVVGSSNTDMIIKVPRIPKPGETILGGSFSTAAGGKGANQAVAAARAGGDVTLIACLGKDMFGEEALNGFRTENINVNYIRLVDDVPSGVALIFVAQDGENSIAVASGANARLTPHDIYSAEAAFVNAHIVMMQLETPIETVRAAAELAAEYHVRTILNPAPAQPLPDDLWPKITILTPNESEAELLTGIRVISEETAKRAAQILMHKGVAAVLITLGAKGAFIASGDYYRMAPGFQVAATDTTAAGDVYNGALAVALARGDDLYRAVVYANATAALSVTKLGAQPSAPTVEEILKFLAQQDVAMK